MVNLLATTNALLLCLQQKNENIATFVRMLKIVKDELKKYSDDGWEELLGVVTTFCTERDIFVPNMEDAIPGRTTYHRRVDGQIRTYYHFLHRDIFCVHIEGRLLILHDWLLTIWNHLTGIVLGKWSLYR
ncbi:hypothetical protein M9H77_09316 [Catharanthus roseus]|uniref:Uncharacterized protein n=1 Tax=Catharanthus roseus TaxID=4058 RepID=A0ACC0C0E7_CATRO|nr:hypothetical protein M9H77_09316 [Catharanthus roseus]